MKTRAGLTEACILALLGFLQLTSGCAEESESPPPEAPQGGTVNAAGGTTGVALGGSEAGTPSTGGVLVASGGANGSGGLPGAGGDLGSGGLPGAGGDLGSGGLSGVGGVFGAGGVTGSGGIVGAGGAYCYHYCFAPCSSCH